MMNGTESEQALTYCKGRRSVSGWVAECGDAVFAMRVCSDLGSIVFIRHERLGGDDHLGKDTLRLRSRRRDGMGRDGKGRLYSVPS